MRLTYRKLKTTPEVYAVIRASHPREMNVYGSFSAPDGYHGSDLCVMETDWCLNNHDGPFLGCRVEWFKDKPSEMTHEYWLWTAIEPDDE